MFATLAFYDVHVCYVNVPFVFFVQFNISHHHSVTVVISDSYTL